MNLKQALKDSESMIEQLVDRVKGADISLKDAEKEIENHIQQLGQIMLNKVLIYADKPILPLENRIIIGDKEYRYDGLKYTRSLNAFKAEKAS